MSQQLREWLARAEIMARGIEPRRYDAARALESGRPWEARYEALAMLDELPRSRVALALWADAAEMMLLDHEAAEALERLAGQVPFRADVWYRLALARMRLGLTPGDALERAAEAIEPVEAADAARLLLADNDLDSGDPARAERWTDQLSLGARNSAPGLSRRISFWLETADFAHARAAAVKLSDPAVLDGRGWLLRARLRALEDPSAATGAFVRALLLNAPGAKRIVSEHIAALKDARAVARFKSLIADLGEALDPTWRAAFATADGDPQGALAALADGAAVEDSAELLERYSQAALGQRSGPHVIRARALAHARNQPANPTIVALAKALTATDSAERLAALDAATDNDWAADLRQSAYAAWCEVGQTASWGELLDELSHLCREFPLQGALREVEAIALDLERPLRVAVLGEFNAGKSSFINALLGESVAPVGVLPTTATINRLVWAPDRFARIEACGRAKEPDRLVLHAALAATLAEIEPSSVERVTIYAPLELLRLIEIIDTPGFNAADASHARTARAAFAAAHVVIWLFDATQPMKDSERAILAEIRGQELPVIALVNKLDRLADAENSLNLLVEHVSVAVKAMGLRLLLPPVAFSARLALAGRAGDSAAYCRSRWAEIEQLVESFLVSNSASLREAALRRQARDIARRLAEASEERDHLRRAEALARAEQAERLHEAMRQIRSRRVELEAALAAALNVALAELERDLRAVLGYEQDPATHQFIVSRARQVIAKALAERAVRWSGLQSQVRDELEQRLQRRLEPAAMAVAPWLRGDEPWSCRSESTPPGAPRSNSAWARNQLVSVCSHELGALAEESLHLPPVAARPRGEARAIALARALEAALGPA